MEVEVVVISHRAYAAMQEIGASSQKEAHHPKGTLNDFLCVDSDEGVWLSSAAILRWMFVFFVLLISF